MSSSTLSHNALRFIAEYLAVMPRNASAAYRRVHTGASREVSAVESHRLMHDERVKAEIDKREEQLRDDLALTAKEVTRELCLLALADPRELSEHHIGACRYCHGIDHKYQRTPAEYQTDLDAYADRTRGKDPLCLEFDVAGGVGFNPYANPATGCPECFGHGVGYERYADTRNLSPSAARLYIGTKKTRDGIEIKTRCQHKALEMAGQALGLFKSRVELGGINGQPIQTASVSISAATTDPIEAAKLYQKLVGGG